MESDKLICNFKDCYKVLNESAFVTFCSHIFCSDHGEVLLGNLTMVSRISGFQDESLDWICRADVLRAKRCWVTIRWSSAIWTYHQTAKRWNNHWSCCAFPTEFFCSFFSLDMIRALSLRSQARHWASGTIKRDTNTWNWSAVSITSGTLILVGMDQLFIFHLP